MDGIDILLYGIVIVFLIFFLRGQVENNLKAKDSVSNYLPWGYLLDDNGLIFNKNGSLQKTFKIRGFHYESLEQFDLVYLRARINNVLKRMDGNWSIHIEARRVKAQEYTPSTFKEKVLQKIDNIRAKNYNSGKYFQTENYITFSWLPPADRVSKIKDIFIEINNINEDVENRRYIVDFNNELREYLDILKKSFKEIIPLNAEETLTYLHSCFSQNDSQKVIPMRKNIFLDAYLSDTPIVDGIPIRVGDEYVGIIGILSFPTETFPGMFEEINKLGFPLRWVSRYIFLNREDSIKDVKIKKGNWSASRKSVADMAEDKLAREDRGTRNYEAEFRDEEAIELIGDLQSDALSMGYYTFSVIIKDKSIKELEKKLEEVLAIVQGRGFVAIKESVNILQAYFGSMPGNIQHNVRKHPVTTMTVIDLLQFFSIWNGNNKNKHLNAPALFFGTTTDGSSPVYFNLHVKNVGHCSIFGETGGGKSVLLAFLASQFKKYKNSQVFIFDKGGSSRVLTTAVKGKFYDLGKDNLGFQPLSKIGILDENIEKNIEMLKKQNLEIEVGKEKEDFIKEKALAIEVNRANLEKEWAFEWLCEIYNAENIALNPEKKIEIYAALTSLAEMPRNMRTLSKFKIQLQHDVLRQGIIPYTKDGAFGRYFDNSYDSFTTEYSWQAFEMETLLKSKMACPPMLTYIFHKLESEMFAKEETEDISEKKPSLLIIDESWVIMKNSKFAAELEEWLRTLRKKEVSVVFATQEITDILKSEIKDILLTSCPTKIFLPYPQANTQEHIYKYKALGLNLKQINLISELESQRDYYAVSREGSINFKIDLSNFEIAFLGANSLEDQSKCKEIVQELKNIGITDKSENFEEEFYNKWKVFKNLEETL